MFVSDAQVNRAARAAAEAAGQASSTGAAGPFSAASGAADPTGPTGSTGSTGSTRPTGPQAQSGQGAQFVYAAATVANVLCDNLTQTQINLLANFLSVVTTCVYAILTVENPTDVLEA